MKKNTVIEIISMLFIILFLYTGISKIMDVSIFKEQLSYSPVLAPVANSIAILLPWSEFAAAVLLIVPRWRLKGLYISLIMMTAFTVYILAILNFSDHLPCSCGGIINLLSWKQHLLFNSIFIALAFWAIILRKKIVLDHSKNWDLIQRV